MAPILLKPYTCYFNSFEAREEAFNQSISHLIPCKYNGPQRFWREFNQIIQQHLPKIKRQTAAYITSNPRDCLAFGTTRQVLTAARMLALSQNSQRVFAIEKIAAEFDLLDNINQSIRTLSGGETVKLALAKTDLLCGYSHRLTIASPFCWLSNHNIHLLTKVVKAYQDRNLPVKIYALEKEDDPNETSLLHSGPKLDQGPCFDLETQNTRVVLETAVTEIGAPPQTAAISDVNMRLTSPCLIQGDNGQGKSLFAKVLSGAVKICGKVFIGKRNGTSRMLFQDVINQTLLRSFKYLIGSQCCSKENEVKNIFKTIWRDYHLILGNESEADSYDLDTSTPSLLAIKVLLVAVRLCGLPPALILDEPDWGLTRKSAEAFVLAVIRRANDLAVPILIISHKPWWQGLVCSRLTAYKVFRPLEPNNSCCFTIVLEKSSG
jgi:ABC-type multidrug transport system ATPase subunit